MREAMAMRFEFHPRHHAADNHVADFEVIFEEGPLCGLKLVGGSVWRSRRHDDAQAERLFVTLPSRRVHGKYFDLLRSASRDRHILRDFKERVVCALRVHRHDDTTKEARS